MKNGIRTTFAIAAGFFLLAGCKKKDDSTTAAPASPPAVTTPTPSNTAADATKTVPGAMQDAKAQATDATATATDTAKTKLAQVGNYLMDKKYDAADALLKEVEGMKSSLSPDMQKEVTDLRSKVDLAKNANGVMNSLPSMGGK
jgi:hypothetical protein